STASTLDGGTDSSAGDGTVSTGEGGGGNDSGSSDARLTDASSSEGGALGLLVDNMTATTGTQIALQVPPGETPGTYYTYSDYPTSNGLGMMSIVSGTSQLVDVPVSPSVTNADRSQIVGQLCFEGNVVGYAGLGMSLAYGNPPDATPESGISSPVPFDASHYSGVSFYIRVDPTDGSQPSIHFGVPDTQTADPSAWPATACAAQDAGNPSVASDAGDASDGGLDAGPPTNPCDDDFGADLSITPGMWMKQAFKWSDLQQQTWGVQFTGGLKPDQLIGMKWQANGVGGDAATQSFRFCISDIYFTP
ncbi:MAG: hypothetical protein M3O46_03725, partial [Myxococcota bacterium]|nr:hypothetical protein [Myxococcota bacterium]